MRARGTAIQGTLAAIGLLTAYSTWQREATVDTPGEAVVVSASSSDLQKVHYDDGKGWMELERHTGDDGVWLRLSAKQVGPTQTPERLVRGSGEAEKLFKRFAPLEAARSLGVLPADKLKEIGLDTTKRHLELMLRGDKRTFKVALSPLGAGDPYIQDERDGKVYVFSNTTLNDLDAASVRLVDRRMHTFMIDELDGFTVSAEGKKREFVRKAGETKLTSKFAPKDKPDQTDDLVKNWHDRLWNIVPLDVMGADEKPKAGAPKVEVRLDYTFRGRPVGWIELAKITHTPTDTSTAAPATVELYARTEHTAGWVRITAGIEDLYKEGSKIAAGNAQ
ncbi:MAG TPA: hypothetical protein VH877_23915 [Polyangia bacterium]|jgi:hypothetical protein|nr:hypothetical protein [Polyangia bacterium]